MESESTKKIVTNLPSPQYRISHPNKSEWHGVEKYRNAIRIINDLQATQHFISATQAGASLWKYHFYSDSANWLPIYNNTAIDFTFLRMKCTLRSGLCTDVEKLKIIIYGLFKINIWKESRANQ